MKKLKTIRIVLSVVLLLLFTLLVADISGVLPYEAHRLERMQFVPALLSMGIGIDAFWLVFAFTFGRLYCSSVCPLGSVQDIFSRLGLLFRGKRKRATATESRILHSVMPFCLQQHCVWHWDCCSFQRLSTLTAHMHGLSNQLLSHRIFSGSTMKHQRQ